MKTHTSLAMVLSTFIGIVSCTDTVQTQGVATINGQTISDEAFNAYLKFKRIPNDDNERRQRALNQFLKREALAKAIEANGQMDQALIQAEIDEFRREMLIGRYFERFLNDRVSDDSVRSFYNAHSTNYEAKSIHAAHLLIRVDPRMTEVERQARLSTAHEAYSRLQKGEAFADVVAAYSEDSASAKKGGDLGWLREGAVSPEFSNRVFGMQKGDISEPFLTPFGFHIVTVLDGPSILKRPLEAVEGDIRYQMRHSARQAEIERLTQGIKVVQLDGKS